MNSPILALDLGSERTGVALSESGLIASPLTTLLFAPHQKSSLVQAIMQLIEQYDIQTLVIGTPLQEDSEQSTQSNKFDAVTEAIRAQITTRHLPVTLIQVNEYASTQEALTLYPESDKDAAAAAVILQRALEEAGVGW